MRAEAEGLVPGSEFHAGLWACPPALARAVIHRHFTSWGVGQGWGGAGVSPLTPPARPLCFLKSLT